MPSVAHIAPVHTPAAPNATEPVDCSWCPERRVFTASWRVHWLTEPYAIGGPERSLSLCACCLSEGLDYAISMHVGSGDPSVTRIRYTTERSAA